MIETSKCLTKFDMPKCMLCKAFLCICDTYTALHCMLFSLYVTDFYNFFLGVNKCKIIIFGFVRPVKSYSNKTQLNK